MNSPLAPALRFLAAIVVSAAMLNAAAPPPTTSKQEPVALSPFIVEEETDTGYAATNALEGSRLNTALRDTPGSISIFTKDLLDDLGATSLEDILRYDVNADLTFGGDDAVGAGSQDNMFGDQGLNFSVRGLPGTSSVDGFQAAGQGNTYNVERVGSTRGPNAILFGTGSAGGNLNFRTRTAQVSRDVTSFDFKVASESTKRAAIDVNRALRKNRLGVRVMGVWDRKGSPRPHQFTELQAITLASQYQFSRDTRISVSYERGITEGVSGRNWNHVDAVSRFATGLAAGDFRWNPERERYENANGTTLNNAVAGTGNLGHRTTLIYGPDLTVPPVLLEGPRANANYVTFATASSIFNTSAGNAIVTEEYEPHGAVTSSGAGEMASVSTNNFTTTFNHRWFSTLHMELAYNNNTRHSDTTLGGNPSLRADLNYRLPDGSLNPYFYGHGYYFSEQQMLRLQRAIDNETVRAAFSYDADLGRRWGTHRFAVMAERNVNVDRRLRSREVWAGRPYHAVADNGNNRVFRRRYFRMGGPFADYTAGFQPVNPFNLESFQSGVAGVGELTTTWVAANDRDFDDEITTDSYMAVMQNYLFNRRLVTTFGVRDDSITATGPRTLRDSDTGAFRFATPADQPVFTPLQQQWYSTDESSGVRRSVGAVFHVTRNFSLTANYSNGVGLGERNRSVLPFDLTPPPFKGTGHDYGIAFTFLDNRISGSIKRYESQILGDRVQGGESVFVNPNNDIMTTFEHYLREGGVTTFGGSDPIRSLDELSTVYISSADAYLSDRVSEGTELELVANPMRNWTLRAAYSYTDRTRTNVFNEGVPWWADRVSMWQALDRLYTTRTGRPSIMQGLTYDPDQGFGTFTVAQRMAQSDDELATLRLEQEQAYGNRRHKANIWTRYSFTSGPLRGFAVGGGWRYQSANVAGVVLSTGKVLWGNPRSVGDLFLQYRTKGIAGLWADAARVTYQLNITNVLDDRTINATKLDVDTMSGIVFPRRAFRENPRALAFTLRLDF